MNNKIFAYSLFAYSLLYCQQIEDIALPTHQSVIHHAGFSLEYSYGYNQPKWIAHLLTKKYLAFDTFRAKTGRIEDPSLIPELRSNKQDFDKFRLIDTLYYAPCPISDFFGWTQESANHSVYLSIYSVLNNRLCISSFDKQKIENILWRTSIDSIYIVTGPIFNVPEPTDLSFKHDITVPVGFYKIYVSHKNGHYEGIAYHYTNSKNICECKYRMVTIDSIQKMSGLDFFPGLPDDIENAVEKNVDSLFWFGTSSIINVPMKIVLKNTVADNRIFDLRGRVIGKYDINSRINSNSMLIINKRKIINLN